MATFSLTIPAESIPGVSLVSQNGRRWTFPAVPPEANHEFPGVVFEEITRPDNDPVNVARGRNLHKISMNWLLAYADFRSIEPDLNQLRQFAREGKWFTINYTPSWGGWWLIVEPLRVAQSMLNEANEITQATVSLVLRRATQITVELAPIKAKGSADIPIIRIVEVAGSVGDAADRDHAQPTIEVGAIPGDPGLGGVGN